MNIRNALVRMTGIAVAATGLAALGMTGVASASTSQAAAAAATNGPLTCTIQTYNGYYLTAVGGGGRTTDVIHTDATRVGSWEKFTLVDVREESEYAAGHAPGAVHLSKGVIERDIEAKVPDPAAPLVL